MSFVAQPFADDVEEDLSPYCRDEVIVARTSLLHTVQHENSIIWRRIKDKLGILYNGQRLRIQDPDHVWLPSQLPWVWSAPVTLYNPHTDQSTGSQQGANSSQEGEHNAKSRHSQSPPELKREKRKLGLGRGDGGDGACSSEYCLSACVGSSTGSSALVTKCKKSKETPVVPGGSDTKYEVMYQCDVCPYISLQEEEAKKHLDQVGHYSASRYLGFISASTQELLPKYISVVSLLKEERHMFKEKIPVCPVCYCVYPSVSQVLSHSLTSHGQYGVYTLRSVLRSETFMLHTDCDKCFDCGVTFTADVFRPHIRDTKHMELFNVTKRESSMVIFICLYCKAFEYCYFLYKEHMCTAHADCLVGGRVTGSFCVIGQNQPASKMLPKDPGIPKENINYDFSKPRLAGDPGFRGVMTKSKERRLIRRERNRKRRQKALQLAKEGKTPDCQKKKKKKKKKSYRPAVSNANSVKTEGQKKTVKKKRSVEKQQ